MVSARPVVAVVVCALAGVAEAAQVSLQADTLQLTVGQAGFVSVTVADGVPDGVPVIREPAGLRVQFSHQGQTTQAVNMRVTRYVRYVYRVTALEPGSWDLGPVEVSFASGPMTTNPLSFQVSPRTAADAAMWHAEAGFDSQEVWVGQVVLYRYATRLRARALRSQWTLPTFDGLLLVRESDAPRREYAVEDEAGRLIVEETVMPFLVTAGGKLDQPPAVVRMDVLVDRPSNRMSSMMGLRQTEPQVIPTGPAKLTAKPLPPAPPGFSGLVGDFTFSQAVERDSLAVGQSGLWTVRAEGTGSLQGFKLPPLDAIDGARVYDNEPVIDGRVTLDGFRGAGGLTRVVVPSREGVLELPPLEIVTFSPTEGRYITHTLPGPRWQVGAGASGAAMVETFGGPEGAAPEGPPADDQPRPLWTSGGDHAWAGGLWLWGLWTLAGLAAAGVGLEAGARALLARRPVAAPVAAPTGRARLLDLPAGPTERLAALESALREELARAPHAALEEALRAVQRARYAGGLVPDALERQVFDAFSEAQP